jgi:hypothetical protein
MRMREIRNSKLEIRNKLKIPNSIPKRRGGEHWKFEFGICFEFRVSRFAFRISLGSIVMSA